MKAVVKHTAGPGGIDLQDLDEPRLEPGKVKVRVAAVGVCGTDRLALDGTYPYEVPLILGHEVSGVVTEVGEGVDPARAAVGDRVALETDAYVCGVCPYCRVEEYNNCPNRRAIGTTADGGLAEWIVIRSGAVHRLPENVSLLAGALVEPLSIATHAVLERATLGVGDIAVVLGPGAIGMLVAEVARNTGARVVLVGRERHTDRLELAQRLGVDRAVASDTSDPRAVVDELSHGVGADVVFECTGAPAVLADSPRLLRKDGQLVLLAFFPEPPMLDIETVIKQELSVVGSRGKRPSSYRRSLRLLSDGKVSVEPLVTHRLPLERWREGFELLGGGRKIVFDVDLADGA